MKLVGPEQMQPATSATTVQSGTTSDGARVPGRGASGVRGRVGWRSRLGSGVIEVPRAPFRDPTGAVLDAPMVPESRRFCGECGARVGRERDGVPGRTAGFCTQCGAHYSFEPQLRAGDRVGGQYDVAGCLAHGGMGWVYLARDRNVSDRWVVLKGVLNSGDHDAMAAALAELRFLAEVEHPNIVRIFNFVEHEGAGYIVMEYVGGTSLKEILAQRRAANGGEADPLPPAQAIAYMIEILPALGYLHEIGLLLCDFKPDHVVLTQHSVKLIDLGGVYRVDDPGSAIYGTVGYQAPEIEDGIPTVPSDLFTVARTLALLCVDVPTYQTTHRFTLPPQDSVPVLLRFDSLHRFLLRGTAALPDDRFQSAEEMADQLYGVLREVVAEAEGRPVPGSSNLFTDALAGGVERPDWHILPRPQVSGEDPGAGFLATLTAGDPERMIEELRAAPEWSVEVELRLAAATIESGDADAALVLLGAIESADPREWRAAWYRGVADLALGRAGEARERFTYVHHIVPGELAPKLALALACELDGDPSEAARWYRIVARTDPSITSASFGLARSLLRTGDRAGALAAYELVPDSSSGYVDAQAGRIRCLMSPNGAGPAVLEELLVAGTILEALPAEGELRERLAADLLGRALELALDGVAVGDDGATLLGYRLVERELRIGLERSYRALARLAPRRAERIILVDEANRKRPRTWT
jgi:serine/threonine-protein kinase PknG